MSESDPGRWTTGRAAPLLLAVLGLLICVSALWRPAESVADGPGQRLVLDLPTWVQFVLLAAALVEFLAIVLIMIPSERRKRPDDARKRSTATRLTPLTMIAVLLPYALVAFAAYQTMRHFESGGFSWLFGGDRQGGWLARGASDPPPQTFSAPLLDLGVSVTLCIVAAVVIALSVLAVIVTRPWVAIAQWLRSVRARRMPSLAADMASALSAARHELAIGDDPRAAVIACYRHCEAALASRRRGRHAAETPREFLRDALAALHLPPRPIRALLQVFERARFSDLPVTRHDRSVALGALDEIRTELARRRKEWSPTLTASPG